MTLEELLEGFRQYSYYETTWEDPSRCGGHCYYASLRFAQYCALQGFRAGLLAVSDPKFRPDHIDFSNGHYVAWVQPFQKSVDWTARQYRTQTDCPRVLNKEQLMDEWEHIALEIVDYIDDRGETSERAAA